LKFSSKDGADFNEIREDKVRDILKRFFPSSGLKILDECVSTQTAVREEIKTCPGRPLLIVARSQSGAFGRFGRKFHSPPGGLWFSFFVPSSLALLNEDCAIKAAEKIKDSLEEELSLDLGTKEPNDIVTPSGSKLAGIIVTGLYSGSKCVGAVLGAGININNDTDFDGVDAASLRELTGASVRLEDILRLCLQSIASLVYDKD